MRISELRASHLPTVGDRVTIVRNDGAAFIVQRDAWDEGAFYRVMADDADATFGDAEGSGTATTLRGVAALIRDAVVVGPEQEDIRNAMRARVSIRNRVTDARKKLSLTAREFLGTRIRVTGVCVALGVTVDDGVIAECEDTDLPGWTYADGRGVTVYLVQYPGGVVGAQFGSKSVYEATLDLAELRLFALLCDPSVERLAQLYVDWCQSQGLPAVSAEELIFEDLTVEQRAWVSAFIGIWEAAE